MNAKMKASDPTEATSACPIRVHVSIRSLMSSTPLGMGGGVEAAAANRSSTVYLQRFSTHATGGPRARKPWVLRQLPAQVPLHLAHRWVDPRLGPAPAAGQSP